MQTIQLHFFEKTELPALQATQGDVGRKFQAVITDGTLGYKIPEDARFSLWYAGTSGEGNYTDIGDRSAFSVSGNTVTVELIAQMLTCSGGGELSLCMSRPDGSRLGLWRIQYQVEPLPGADSPEAEAYYTAFSESVAKLHEAVEEFQTDPSLAVPGKAADAAAVGTALALKASAGFGYGEPMVWLGFDTVTWKETGSFETDLGALFQSMEPYTCKQVQFMDSSGLNSQKYFGTLWKYTADYGVLSATNYSGLMAVKTCYSNTWKPWEWVNPPMEMGVEYCTTQRHNGKIVYRKLMNLGNLPATGSKNVAYCTAGATPVSLDAYLVTNSGNVSPIPYMKSDGVLGVTVYLTRYNVVSNAQYDVSHHTGFATVYYTKD